MENKLTSPIISSVMFFFQVRDSDIIKTAITSTRFQWILQHEIFERRTFSEWFPWFGINWWFHELCACWNLFYITPNNPEQEHTNTTSESNLHSMADDWHKSDVTNRLQELLNYGNSMYFVGFLVQMLITQRCIFSLTLTW